MPEVTQMLTDQYVLVQGLYTIAADSNDADTVRIAMGALTSTEAGRVYLAENPVFV